MQTLQKYVNCTYDVQLNLSRSRSAMFPSWYSRASFACVYADAYIFASLFPLPCPFLPFGRDEAERFPFSLDCETIFYRGLAPRSADLLYMQWITQITTKCKYFT